MSAAVGGAPIGGVTIGLGSRTATTDSNGSYNFSSVPAGTYPIIIASGSGYVSVSVPSIVVTDDAISTQDFSLTLAVSSACLTDTTQADFQAGAITNCDLTGSPGDIVEWLSHRSAKHHAWDQRRRNHDHDLGWAGVHACGYGPAYANRRQPVLQRLHGYNTQSYPLPQGDERRPAYGL